MNLQQLVTKEIRRSPLAREITSRVVRDLDAKRAAARHALDVATAEGELRLREVLDAEVAATEKLQAAVRAQQEATGALMDAWQRRTSAVFVAENRTRELRAAVEALAAPQIDRFDTWSRAVAAALEAAPLPSPGGEGPRRHTWDVGRKHDAGKDAWAREQAAVAAVLDQVRAARERALELRLSGAPQAETAKTLETFVREIRRSVREISALRASALLEGDVLSEPEPAA
jgi:hypothetical protein